MADAVERLMEDMLPELEDLVKRELFTQVFPARHAAAVCMC